jgi:hypothetical protein
LTKTNLKILLKSVFNFRILGDTLEMDDYKSYQAASSWPKIILAK